MSTPNADTLQQISDFLYGGGTRSMTGCTPDRVQEMVVLANQRFPHKSVCVVSDWIYAELEISEADRAACLAAGIEPVMIYSSKVVSDQRRPYFVGGWVRSTPMVSFTEGCLFESRNTIYLLQGPGIAKSVRTDIIMSIQ
ncbi:DUF6957 family protein [Pseudomonas sp. S1(2024)]|uniref:DUF6957 family protein n=1 Tax=Pseudomonas sp. S1(2024) TaxID=3390191 RepID=UPI003979B982